MPGSQPTLNSHDMLVTWARPVALEGRESEQVQGSLPIGAVDSGGRVQELEGEPRTPKNE